MTTNVDIEDIQTTRGEKLLALVMTVFLLIGGIWAYDRLEVHRGYVAPVYTPAEQAAISANDAARQRLFDANQSVQNARNELEISREAYRTAIEAGQPSAKLGVRYRRDTERFETAQGEQQSARAEVKRTTPAANAAHQRAAHEASAKGERDNRTTFLLRLAFVLSALAVSFLAFWRLRRSRYMPLASALVGGATILALVMGVDYVTDYVSWRDLGPLVLSAVGATFTLLAFWGLQRYLAKRVPRRRVRKSECPFCGYPVRGTGSHCEGCGRDVVAECAKCSAPRRVGTAFCAACGSS
ncbi:MAG: zinc ribbon domain-containing protein [Actinomycetota bacterium]|nr:zinc ribbon domain-containing protein [Actinomycetota bacterium]